MPNADPARPWFLVTGCGRSGTNFMAAALCQGGVTCGHEEVFRVTGIQPMDLDGDSSWYAAPVISRCPQLTHVIHLVRHPEKVMRSFYRLGLMNSNPLLHLAQGDTRRIGKWARKRRDRLYQRSVHTWRHRRFLARHAGIFDYRTEVERLEAYWRIWNRLIEDQIAQAGVPSMRVRIEDVGDRWDEIVAFLGLPPFEADTAPTNLKSNYPERPMPDVSLSDETRAMARRYGYDL